MSTEGLAETAGSYAPVALAGFSTDRWAFRCDRWHHRDDRWDNSCFRHDDWDNQDGWHHREGWRR